MKYITVDISTDYRWKFETPVNLVGLHKSSQHQFKVRTCKSIGSSWFHQEIMRYSFKVLCNVSCAVAFNDSPDPGISCDILFPFNRWKVSTNELLVHVVTSFLNSTDTIYEFQNCGMVHSKFCLQSSMGCFHIVVGSHLH